RAPTGWARLGRGRLAGHRPVRHLDAAMAPALDRRRRADVDDLDRRNALLVQARDARARTAILLPVPRRPRLVAREGDRGGGHVIDRIRPALLAITALGLASLAAAPQAPAKYGGTLVVALTGTPNSLDPTVGTSNSRNAINAMCLKLYEYGNDRGKVEFVP